MNKTVRAILFSVENTDITKANRYTKLSGDEMYETWRCNICNNDFTVERLVSISLGLPIRCPFCGKKP